MRRIDPNVRFFECDITSSAALGAVATEIRSTWGADPSILVNNAGIAGVNPILNVSEAWVRKVFDVNVVASFLTVQTFLPAMIARGKGHVVTVASAASFVTVAGFVDYCASKAAVMAFHEGLQQELKHRYPEAARGIATTCVHPNYVATPLIDPYANALDKAGQGTLTREEVAGAIVKQILSGRGAQIILPREFTLLAGLRGWPHWFQEVVRDITKTHIK